MKCAMALKLDRTQPVTPKSVVALQRCLWSEVLCKRLATKPLPASKLLRTERYPVESFSF